MLNTTRLVERTADELGRFVPVALAVVLAAREIVGAVRDLIESQTRVGRR